MIKTDSFLGNEKLSLNQNVWRDHATMQQDIFLHFLGDIAMLNQAEIRKKNSVVQLSLSTPTFSLSTLVDNSQATWKKPTKCNKVLSRHA